MTRAGIVLLDDRRREAFDADRWSYRYALDAEAELRADASARFAADEAALRRLRKLELRIGVAAFIFAGVVSGVLAKACAG